MSDNALSEKEVQEIKAELARASVTSLQQIFTTAPGELSWEEIEQALAAGQSLKDICNLSDDYMENSCHEGRELLECGEFSGAREIFATLCLYDQQVPEYWAGLGKACEGLEYFAEAVNCYRMLLVVTGGREPLPCLSMGYCQLALGDREGAREILELGREICDPGDEEQRPVLELIEKLIAASKD